MGVVFIVTRRDFDFYETPTLMADYMVRMWIKTLREAREYGFMFEPCVGDRALVNVIENRVKDTKFVTNDVDTSRVAGNHFDMTHTHNWNRFKQKVDIGLVVTNPPFSAAFDILQNAHRIARFGVLLLLRLSFLEPTKKRGEWLKRNPPNRVMIFGQPRPSFTAGGNDSVTTAWMFWSKVDPRYYPIEFATRWKT